jgi:hypothetical protein
MARRSPPRKVTYFEPVAPRLARNTVIESTFDVGRRFRCTMRIDCGELDPGAVIRPDPGEWHPRMPETGGNLTGVSPLTLELIPKRLEPAIRAGSSLRQRPMQILFGRPGEDHHRLFRPHRDFAYA